MKTLLLAILLSTSAFAGQQEFSDGYSEGYHAIRGDMILVPLTPLSPIAPIGSTDFREGILQGIEDGQEDEGGYGYRYEQ